MNTKRGLSRRWILLAAVMYLLGLALPSCTGGTSGPVEVVSNTPAEEEDTASEEPEEVPEEEVNGGTESSIESILAIWLPNYSATFNVPEEWLSDFMAENSNIELEWQYIPAGDYSTMLVTALAAGDTPDIALMDYNMVASLNNQGSLLPVGNLINTNDYLNEALDLVAFEGNLYGAPWLRAGCAADYQYLTVFNNGSVDMNAAEQLINFLTQQQYQYDFYEAGAWLPTNPALYDELGIMCEINPVIRLDPVLVQTTIQTVADERASLSALLGNRVLNAQKATAVILDDLTVRAAPIYGAPSAAEAISQLDGGGLLLGAIFAEEGFRNYPAGNYTVTCQRSDNIICMLESPAGDFIEVEPDRFEDGLPSVPFATCIVEEGSREFCWSIDGLKFCLRIG